MVTMSWLLRALWLVHVVLLCISFHGSTAFSVSFPDDTLLMDIPLNDEQEIFEEEKRGAEYMDSYDVDEPRDHVDQYIDLFKRYSRGWGHQTRFPWKRLPNRMCFRQKCERNRHCCRQFNLCDPSAKVCVDCWYGARCKSEKDCCQNYPYCARTWKRNPRTGYRYIAGGKCVRKL